MIPKLAVVLAAAVAAALAIAVPDPYAPAVLAAVAVLAFGLYALRHRSALRGLSQGVSQVDSRAVKAIGGVKAEVDKLVAAGQAQAKQLRELTEAVDEVRKLSAESTAVNGVAVSVILDRLNGLEPAEPLPPLKVPTPLPMVLHDRVDTIGLAYGDQRYIPLDAVTQAFQLETAQARGQKLRVVNAARAPRVLEQHDPRGTWLSNETISVEGWKNVVMDGDTGLPMTIYSWGTFLYPITVAHYGLQMYSKWVTGEQDALAKAEAVGDWLAAHQDERGGWPVPFEYTFRKGATDPLAPGWYSGMAQGMACDLLAKLAVVKSEQRYADAALKGLEILSLPVEDGGVQRFYNGEQEWWEEYPTLNRPTYVLNGYLYALIGVYDTAVLLDSAAAMARYRTGLKTLVDMVNLYDLGHRTAYDLLHFSNPGTPPNIARWGYHNLHVTLVSAVNCIEDGVLAEVGTRWAGYSRGISAPHN